MSAQTSYSYSTPKGVAGGLYDISPYAVDSRINGETSEDALLFGMGAVQGDNPGVNVKVPTSADTAAKFEGLVLTGFTNEMDKHGDVHIAPLQTVGTLVWGRAWARIVPGITPTYGQKLYLVNTGENAGLFTNIPGSSPANLAISGRFLGGAGTGDVALIELYNNKA
jgi:hypothetical protein